MNSTRIQFTVRAKDGTRKQMFSRLQVTPYHKYIRLKENMHNLKSNNERGPPLFSFPATEVIDFEDPIASKFDKAKQKEMECLPKRKTGKC